MTDIPDPSNVLKIKDNPNELVFYTNIAGVRATPEEIIIHFGLREDDPNSGIFVAKAVMSLAHAKRLVAALSRTISNYEVNFGEVVVEEPDSD